MLHIGMHNNDNIFLAMAPKCFLYQDEILTPGTPSGATQMTQPHVRMATCILLWAMGRIAHTDYSTRPNAYVALQGTLDQYRSVTDWVYVLVFHVILNLSGKILNPYPLFKSRESGKAMLKLADISSMHNTMINHYHSTFAHNAPPEWQDDPWFMESVPLIVSMKYGRT